MIQTAIIPTTLDKLPWLKVTLQSLALQEGVKIERVLLTLDLKPWDSKTPTEDIKTIISNNTPFKVEVNVLRPPMKTKRQHAGTNMAIAAIHEAGNQQVLLMDDDYWFKTRTGLAELFAHSSRGTFVTPVFFDEVKVEERSNWLPDPVAEGDEIRYFSQANLETHRITCDLSERGQHPMCGHPKIFFTEDFMFEKGFDVPGFQHYWWCDTDLYYRLKRHFEFKKIPVETWHMNHPRYNPQMFQKPNARRFLQKHQAIGEIAKPHLDALNNQLME